MNHFISKIKPVITLLAFFSHSVVIAQQVPETEARQKALDFFNSTQSVTDGVRRAPARGSNIQLAYTASKDGNTCFYVYNRGDNDGFVIIGGDEVAEQILAYNNQGHFDYDNAPDNFKNILQQYAEQITAAKLATNNQSAQSPARTTATPIVQKTDIADLITTTWKQEDPYNRTIPKLVDSNTGIEYTPLTGCVPTATAQIMKYWNYPHNGVGQDRTVMDYSQINGYNPGGKPFTPEFGTVVHEIDYAGTTYDWANMLDSYDGTETETQITAVSTLMYHIGIASGAVYGVNATTGAYPVEGLKKHFGYSQNAREILRDKFDDQTWEEIIYTELAAGRPVLYSGIGSGYVGHEYIIHGYSSEYDMYKVNWGWGGLLDCYCKLTPLSGSGSTLMGYENNQTAAIRLQPSTLDDANVLEYGDTFWSGGVKYSIISQLFKTVEVARPERTETQYADTINVPATVTYQGNNYSVIGLGESCFALWGELDSNGNESYWSPYDSQIKAINLASGISYIRDEALEYCGNLEHIEIPNSVTIMGWFVFSHCYNLKNVTLPNNIREIPSRCFYWCNSLERIEVPEGVSSIDEYAFSWCNKLSYVSLPSTLNQIGNYVFDRCDNLDVLVCKPTTPPTLINSYSGMSPFTSSASSGYLLVPEEAIDVYKETQYWKDWKNILPLESTDISAIGDTITIENITYKLMPSGAEVIDVLINNVSKITIPDIIIVNNKEYKITSLGSGLSFYCDTIALPQYLSAIKSSAFKNSSAKEILIPESVTAIGSYAFSGCRNLEKIVLPDSLKEISEDCFYDCDKLSIVVLPRNLESINYSAFVNCPNLFTFVCKSEDVPVWNNMVLNMHNYVEGTIYVPKLSIQAYRESDDWKVWRFIKPIDEYDEDEEPIITEHNGLKYRLLEHGAVLTGYNYVEENIVIPETVDYNGNLYKVISIGYRVFNWQSTIKTVQLPSSIHSILSNSFWQCNGLTSINLPDNIAYIGDGAFQDCSQLERIHYPASLKVLGPVFGGTAIEKLIIPEGVESVERKGGSTFGGMSSLKEVVIPSSVDMIRTYGYSIGIHPNTEKVFVLAPNKISGTFSGNNRQTTAYVPTEYLEEYQRENDPDNFFGHWYFKEVLPIVPLTGITAEIDTIVITRGMSDTLNVTYAPMDASLKYVKWNSSNPAIASVNDDGIVTAHSAGTTTIVATSMYYPEFVDSIVVNVIGVKYTIDFVNYDGTLLQSEVYEEGTLPTYHSATPIKPANEHASYEFSGWYPALGIVQADAHYRALFKGTGDSYQVSFLNYDGTVLSESDYVYGEYPAYEGAVPIKPSTEKYTYTFIKWNHEPTDVQSEQTYIAVFDSIINATFIIASGNKEDVYWVLTKDSILTVSGTGTFEFDYSFGNYTEYVREAYILDGIILGYGALGWCYNLTKVELPDNIETIPSHAFYADRELKEINIPSNVASIGDYAFYGCSELIYIEIPAGITKIDECAIAACHHLQFIKCNALIPPTLGENAFLSVTSDIPVYVPCGSVQAYRADAEWSYFTNIIETQYSVMAVPENISHGYTTIVRYPNCENDTTIVEAETYYGYIFSHWSDGNTDNPRTIVLSSDTVLTAHFVAGYYVYFHDAYGSLIHKQTVPWGEIPVYTGDTPSMIAKGEGYHYVFTGWYPNLKPTITDEHYYAEFQFERDKYSLSFIDEEAENLIYRDSIEYGAALVPIEAPIKEGYTFFYWEGLSDGMSMPAHDVTVTAVYAIQGDVNLDERVNITDAVGIVNDRLGYASANFYRELSDINRDELFTIADAISVLNIMYGEPINSIARAPQIYAQEDVLTLKSNADYSLALDLSTSNFYSAFQFDIIMPLDINLSDIALNESRCSGFAVQYNKIEEGKYRVVAFNLDNSPLSMVDGNLLTMSFTGVHELDNIELSNIHFSTQTGIDVMIPDISLLATSIDKTTVNDNAVEYNAAGIRLGNGAKGIVIINRKKIIKQ